MNLIQFSLLYTLTIACLFFGCNTDQELSVNDDEIVDHRKSPIVITALNITFDEVNDHKTTLSIAWDDTRIDIPVELL
ncbi:MAG: hypothetical protein WD599_07480 [Balneolaceae bacterium]